MSSSTSNTSKDWRDFTSTEARALAGKVRRMAITLTSGTFWQAVGHLLLDNTTKETADAEVFSGVGFYARPPAGANAEAILAFPGGPSNPTIVATRDEATRKAVAGGCAQDETFVFNSKVAIKFTAGGLIQAYLVGGPAPVQLALKSDVDAVITAHNTHKHPGVTAGGAVTGLADILSVTAVGSSALRG
jgi:phage gp45-like